MACVRPSVSLFKSHDYIFMYGTQMAVRSSTSILYTCRVYPSVCVSVPEESFVTYYTTDTAQDCLSVRLHGTFSSQLVHGVLLGCLCV